MPTLELEMDRDAAEAYEPYQAFMNDPVNHVDPMGTSPEDVTNHSPPPGVPEYIVYRYTEDEWKAHPIDMRKEQGIGPYIWIPVSRTDNPEGHGTASWRALGQIFGYILTAGHRPGGFIRDRVDYVDVTYKLSYQNYPGVDSTTGSNLDGLWIANHANVTFQ